jgi:hypothetical protein
MGKAVNAASDLEQATGAVNIVFGDSANIIEKFGQTSATAVGLAESEFKQLSAVTGSFLQNLGFDADEAANQTIILTERASDMAAVFNTDVSQALKAIQSGLKGEFNPLEQFGVKINAAAIEAKALSMGLAATKSELDDNAKAQAALALVMEQTDRIAGQFSRESETFAVKMQILKARFSDAAAELGQRLLPVAIDLLEWASDMLDRFDALDPQTKTWIVRLAGVTAALGPLLIAGGKTLTMLSNMSSLLPSLSGGASGAAAGIGSIGTSALGILGPIAAAVAALGVFYAIIKKVQNAKVEEIQITVDTAETYGEYKTAVENLARAQGGFVTETGAVIDQFGHVRDESFILTEETWRLSGAYRGLSETIPPTVTHFGDLSGVIQDTTTNTGELTTAEDKLSETLNIAYDALNNANIPLSDRERLMRELKIAAGDATLEEYALKDATEDATEAFANGRVGGANDFIALLERIHGISADSALELHNMYRWMVQVQEYANSRFSGIYTGGGYGGGGGPSQGAGGTPSPTGGDDGGSGGQEGGVSKRKRNAIGGFYLTNSPTYFESSEYGQRERAIFIPQGKTIFDVATVDQIADIMPKGEFGTRKIENHYHLNANYKYQSPLSLMDEVRLREAASV